MPVLRQNGFFRGVDCGIMTEYIKAIANIVSIVFVTYGIFVLHKWKKVADKLDALMEEMKDD